MAKNDIKEFSRRVSALIDSRRLHEAIAEIKERAHRQMAWEVEDKIKSTEQNYAYMLNYLTQGAVDPERDEVYMNIVNDIYGQLDALVSYVDSVDSPTLYYSNLRYQRMHADTQPLAAMVDDYRKAADKVSLFSMVLSAGDAADRHDRVALERLQSDLFIRIWTIPRLSSDDVDALRSLLESPQIKPQMQQYVVSAITLGLLQQYDQRRLALLMQTYLSSDNVDVTSAALVGLLLGLWKYRDRPLTSKLRKILDAIKDRPSWRTDLRIAFIELIRARDTERINRKMRDEVIPRMQKLRPDLLEKFNKFSLDQDEQLNMQENPEWQDLLQQSGVADQLKEITEIQMEGGDVMMSTFANLKYFNFFQTISNWFLPYDQAHTAISAASEALDVIGDVMENARFMCDSDKYSFMLAVGSVSDQQRQLMLSQLRSQTDAILEMMSQRADLTAAEERRLSVNQYMQNIYRFFKLFYRKAEFFDPFDQSINLISVPSLAEDFDDAEMLRVVAEFYFKLNYMGEALNVYLHLDKLDKADASRYQKMGYCYERLGELPSAVEYYDRALLAGPDNAWTIRRLATVHRTLGDKAQALKYYKQLASMLPDDMKTALLYGQALLEVGDVQQAMQEFYRVEFLDETSHRVWRPLAWTLFLAGDFGEARGYYDKIIAEEAKATDYLNRGHVRLALGDIAGAVDDYIAGSKLAGDKEWLTRSLQADTQALLAAGIDSSIIPLVADAALYKS